MRERREFVFSRKGFFSPALTFVWVLITIYFLWRIGQMITGDLPLWLLPVPVLAIAYMWMMRLKPVKAIVVEGDGNVIFVRHWGRCEMNAIYIQRVRPWGYLSRAGSFVLTHAAGWELLIEDRERATEVVHELLRHNPDIEVQGVPPLSEGVPKHTA